MKTNHRRCTNHHRRCTKARSPKPQPARADARYASRVLRGRARAPRLVAAAQSRAGSSASVSRPAAAARSQGGSSEFGIRLRNGATAPNKGAAPGGRLHRRAAHRQNSEDADRNSHCHRTRSACVVNGPPLYSALYVAKRASVRSDGGRVMIQATGSPLAAMNKCLAQRNKTRTRPKATNKRPAARRNFVRRQPARPRCGVSAAGLSPPFGGAKSR